MGDRRQGLAAASTASVAFTVAEQDRDLHRQQQHREEQLARAHLRRHRGEERADRGEADGAEDDHQASAGQHRPRGRR